MTLSKSVPLTAIALAVLCVWACATIARHHPGLLDKKTTKSASIAKADPDPISGEWNVSFFVRNSATPGTFTLKLDGSKVTGTAYSDHTGEGTVRNGKWVDGKLSFTLDFKKHESIAITGTLKDGKLMGEFQTEGFTAKWEATKKVGT